MNYWESNLESVWKFSLMLCTTWLWCRWYGWNDFPDNIYDGKFQFYNKRYIKKCKNGPLTDLKDIIL